MARMAINQSIRTPDPGSLLQDETGYFELTSPSGEKFQAVCEGGHSLSSLTAAQEQNWTVRKIGEAAQQAKQQRAT